MISNRYFNDGKERLKLNRIQKTYRNRVNSKVDSGEYMFETVKCPVCESVESKVLSEKDRYGLYFPVVLCSGCGLIRTNPRMSQQSYNLFYNSEYRKLYVGEEKANEVFFKSQKNKGKAIYEYLINNGFIPDKKEYFVLEIGCGAGGILQYFKEQGARIKGVDLGEEYIDYGRDRYHLNLEYGTIDDIEKDIKPDIIIYSHVLEHILDPVRELKLIKDHCNPDTVVYIEVPGIKAVHKNYRSDFLTYFQNAHVFHFSLNSLKNLMQQNGFKYVAGNEYIRSIFLLNNENAFLPIVSDVENVSKYIYQTEKSRNQYYYSSGNIKKEVIRLLVKWLKKTGLK